MRSYHAAVIPTRKELLAKSPPSAEVPPLTEARARSADRVVGLFPAPYLIQLWREATETILRERASTEARVPARERGPRSRERASAAFD